MPTRFPRDRTNGSELQQTTSVAIVATPKFGRLKHEWGLAFLRVRLHADLTGLQRARLLHRSGPQLSADAGWCGRLSDEAGSSYGTVCCHRLRHPPRRARPVRAERACAVGASRSALRSVPAFARSGYPGGLAPRRRWVGKLPFGSPVDSRDERFEGPAAVTQGTYHRVYDRLAPGPAARIPASLHKSPTRLLAREAFGARQTEFDSAGPGFRSLNRTGPSLSDAQKEEEMTTLAQLIARLRGKLRK
jgi:hypothetical protein